MRAHPFSDNFKTNISLKYQSIVNRPKFKIFILLCSFTIETFFVKFYKIFLICHLS